MAGDRRHSGVVDTFAAQLPKERLPRSDIEMSLTDLNKLKC